MEFILSLGKEVLLVPVWALIQTPFLRWSAKLAKASSVTIKAAFVLGLITGAASLVLSLILYPLYALIGDPFAKSIGLIAAFAITVWMYGYFLRGETGNSIGMWRGTKVFILEIILLAATLFTLAYLVVLVESALT